MNTSEKFHLQYNDFKANIITLFQDIRKDNEYSDVTLACAGNGFIEAHKVILSASSTLFRDLLRQNKHSHPLLYMRGIQMNQMRAIVDFIYHGEVNVYQEDLNDFMEVAKELELKGLSWSFSSEGTDESNLTKHSAVQNPTRISEPQFPNDNEKQSKLKKIWSKFEHLLKLEELVPGSEHGINEETKLISVDRSNVCVCRSNVKISTTYDELDEKIFSLMNKIDGLWICKVCDKTEIKKSNLINHIDSKHIDGVSHNCNQCERSFRTKRSMVTHMTHDHWNENMDKLFPNSKHEIMEKLE